MEKILIYPFNRNFVSIINNNSFLFKSNMEIISLITLPGWGLVGDIYKISHNNLKVSTDYASSLNNCDTVWIIDSWLPLLFNEYIYPQIELAIHNNKKVIITRELSEDERNTVNGISKNSNITYLNITRSKTSGRLVELKTPVIAIGGISQNTNKFELQLSLKQTFEDMGYKVLLIASRKEANIFGEYSIPEFMLTNELSENNKIIAFNHFITKLESEKQPDLILLGIPGAITSYDNKYFKDFGVLSFEISRAISIDLIILCSLYADYDMEYFSKSEKIIQNQMGISTCYHTMSPYSVDDSELVEREKIVYLTLDDTIVYEKIKKINYPKLISTFKKQDIVFLANLLIDDLSTSFVPELI